VNKVQLIYACRKRVLWNFRWKFLGAKQTALKQKWELLEAEKIEANGWQGTKVRGFLILTWFKKKSDKYDFWNFKFLSTIIKKSPDICLNWFLTTVEPRYSEKNFWFLQQETLHNWPRFYAKIFQSLRSYYIEVRLYSFIQTEKSKKQKKTVLVYSGWKNCTHLLSPKNLLILTLNFRLSHTTLAHQLPHQFK
jgi:hypothetical protein